jgi:hypothetical protein
LTLLNDLIGDLSENAIRHIKMAMIIIFVYRAMPLVGASLRWWQIDVLGFDAKLTLTLEQYNQTAKPMQYLLIPPFWLQYPIMCVHHNTLPQSAETIKCQ